MKKMAAAVLVSLAASVAAAEGLVTFHVTVKKDGRVTDSPSFLATVGQPVTLRLSDGLAIEALAKPVEPDGRSWTQVRITYFETPESRFVQEMSIHHRMGLRTGSFEYTDPTKRRFVIEIGPSTE